MHCVFCGVISFTIIDFYLPQINITAKKLI